MLIAFRGLLTAWLFYFIFTYIALMIDGQLAGGGIAALFRNYEFFPFLFVCDANTQSLLFWFTGIAIAIVKLETTAVTVSRIAFQDLRGHDVYQSSEAKDYTKTLRKSFLIALFFPAFLAVIMLIPAGIAGFAGRIPLLGPVLIALLALPLMFWAFIIACLLLVFIIGFWQLPAIAAVAGDDTLEMIIESFSVSLKRPLTHSIFQLISRIVVLTGLIALITSALAVFTIFVLILGNTMGSTFSEIITIALYRIPGALSNICSWQTIAWAGYYLKVPLIVDTAASSMHMLVSGWILGISMLLGITALLSYLFSVCFSSQVIIYLSMKYRLSGEDVRLRSDIDYFTPEQISK